MVVGRKEEPELTEQIKALYIDEKIDVDLEAMSLLPKETQEEVKIFAEKSVEEMRTDNNKKNDFTGQLQSFKKIIGKEDKDKIFQKELIFILYELYGKKNVRLYNLLEGVAVSLFGGLFIGSAVLLRLSLFHDSADRYPLIPVEHHKLCGLTAGAFFAFFTLVLVSAFEQVSYERDKEALLKVVEKIKD